MLRRRLSAIWKSREVLDLRVVGLSVRNVYMEARHAPAKPAHMTDESPRPNSIVVSGEGGRSVEVAIAGAGAIVVVYVDTMAEVLVLD